MLRTKQVAVIRKDLNMRKGKIAAQVAHASMKVILDMMSKEVVNTDIEKWQLVLFKRSPLYEWLNGKFTKIVLWVETEEELMMLYKKAKGAGLPCSYIIDSGFTEFHGNKTLTCIAIGPDDVDKINEITGELPLL